jgi:anti-sigma-K factor RskA
MNCNETRELLPAYVLGALEDDEIAEIEAHLRAGHEHDDELVELRATVFALDRFADEESLDEPARPVELARASRPASATGAGRTRPFNFKSAWRSAVAAAAAIAIFASGWLIAGINSGGGQDVSLALRGSGGQTVSLAGNTSQDHVAVAMAGFQALPSHSVYQFWAVRGDTWVRIGVCHPDASGGWTGEFPFNVHSGERIAVTVEPAGGSATPTSAPVLISST